MFAVTPGGFVRAKWPAGLHLTTGWNSTGKAVRTIIDHATRTLDILLTREVVNAAVARTQYLTIGIDVVDGPENAHAELVAVYDTKNEQIIRWTGKSYPTGDQEHTLLHVTDLDSHLLRVAGERVLVLGCHDLNMFSPRGRANQAPDGLRRERCDEMRARVDAFKPTIVLQHPHSTDTPNIWRMPWMSLVKENPSVRCWASGIGYYSWREKPRAPLPRVLELTKSEDGVIDVVVPA